MGALVAGGGVVWSDDGVHARVGSRGKVRAEGLEATGCSALLFVADLATGVSSLLAAELTRSMGSARVMVVRGQTGAYVWCEAGDRWHCCRS